MTNLFVYGIFLDASSRDRYGMTNPRYNTVRDYATFGNRIVQAKRIPDVGLSLTGVIVDLPDDYDWGPLDDLEGGYDRITVTTTNGQTAYMYAEPESEGN